MAGGISLVSREGFLNALDAERESSKLSAFVLPAGKVRDKLADRAADGVDTQVMLAGDGFARSLATLRTSNDQAAAQLGKAGADVEFITGEDGSPTLHAKIALLGNTTAYLNERNWPDDKHAYGMPDAIIRDTRPADVAIILKMFADGETDGNDTFTTHKASALAMEAKFLETSPAHKFEVQTESIGPTVVSEAMAKRASAGDEVRLLVCNGHIRDGQIDTLNRLVDAGVDIRTTSGSAGTEKMALGGAEGVALSANATPGRPDQLDWALRTAAPDVIATLHTHFETSWGHAKPYADG